MVKDELLLFTQYDSDASAPARFTFHTAFSDPRVLADAPSRESIEIRAVAFFPSNEGSTALAKQAMLDTIAELKPDDSETLKARLARGASNGLLAAADIDQIVDTAAYASITNDAVIMDICAGRGIPYVPNQWN